MHTAACNCPTCRTAAREIAMELFSPGTMGEVLSEEEELELAMELLQVQSEEELEQFLGKMFRGIGRGLKAVGRFATKNVFPVLGKALKGVAKVALPILGKVAGSFIPIPGVGTALGGMVGNAVASALEMEFAELEQEEAEVERARRFIRVAASAIRDASTALDNGASAETVARSALLNATRQHLPAAAAALGQRVAMSRPTAGGASAGTQMGYWRRQGNEVVIADL